MNTRRIAIGRIVFALAAFALLAGFTVRSASAQDPYTVVSRASEHTRVCLAQGGTVSVSGSFVICHFPGGGGFVCDVGGTLDDCRGFLTTNVMSDKTAVLQNVSASVQVSAVTPVALPVTAVTNQARVDVVSVTNP